MSVFNKQKGRGSGSASVQEEEGPRKGRQQHGHVWLYCWYVVLLSVQFTSM